MLKKLLTVITMVMLTSSIAFAQAGSIAGTVTDASTGETMPGTSILITELDRGAASDVDGNFRIDNVPAGTYTINATFVGFRTFRQQIQVRAGEVTRVDIDLQIGAVGLDELIVSGYAVTPKRELTGSIASVRSRDIQDITLQNPESLLQGRAAGVQVTNTSGVPGGAFRVAIRGQGSINAPTQPLYIVDGVQISQAQQSGLTSTSPLNAINPNDIESIEVLKDAAAASIYGSQAAAGVVIITTKRGQAGRTTVTARAETGVRSLARDVDYISSEQYVQYLGEAAALNAGVPLTEDISSFINSERNEMLAFFTEDPFNPGQLAETDWQDFIFSDGVTQRYTLAVSGGDETTTFFISGGFEDTEGTAFNSDFKRMSLRTNFDHQITDRIRGSLNLNVSRSTQFGICSDGNFINCPPSQAMFEAPMSFPFLEDGSFNPMTRFGLANNPAVQRDEVDRNVSVNQIIGNLNLTYRANDWLSFNGIAGVDVRNTEDEQFRSPIAAPGQGGFVRFANRNVRNFNTNLVANARQTFNGVHNVSGLIGTEYRRDFSESQFAGGDGIFNPFFKVLSATATPVQAAGVQNEWRIGSYFGNAKYNYNERYFLSFTARYDGHSRFGAETRWGFFPSLSGRWRISEEDFFNVGFIDDLALRVGTGIAGNSAIGNFAARGLFSAVGSYQGAPGLTPTQLANLDLGWEEAREVNIGIDYELLEGRIFGAIDVFRKDNRDLLFERPLAADTGFQDINENIGTVRNEGIEFEISTVNVSTRSFTWSSRFNIAFMRNEILELPEGRDISPDAAFSSLRTGQPIGSIQVPRWAGVNPADGRPMWLDVDGNITYNPVQARDKVDFKDGFANQIGGFGNTMSYKGITLDAFFQFNIGQWAFANTDHFFTRTPDFLMNLIDDVENRWRVPGDITHMPRAVIGGADFPETANYRTQTSTQAINNASYIRLKNVSLSYNLPVSITERVGLGNVRLYASAINLITWTAWQYYDPEVAFSPTDIFNNFTAASSPTERQVNAGIEIRF